MRSLELIAAVAKNGVIGKSGGLPWHLPEDLKHFKATTLGLPIVMGRKTWESVGKPLPKRRNLVVSRTLGVLSGAEVVQSLDEAIALVGDARLMVVGGSGLYAEALPRSDVLWLTELEDAVEGDTFFPSFDRAEWRVVDERFHPRDEKHAIAFWIRKYVR